MNWPMANAKLKATIETPVDWVIGNRNRPVVWRTPIVIMRMAAEAKTLAAIAERRHDTTWVDAALKRIGCDPEPR